MRGARGGGMPQDKRDHASGRLKDDIAQRENAEGPKVRWHSGRGTNMFVAVQGEIGEGLLRLGKDSQESSRVRDAVDERR
jgi:hypothetical protein